MQKARPHVAWVTSPHDDTPQRVQVHAVDVADCVRQALRGMPTGSRASCRATGEPPTDEERRGTARGFAVNYVTPSGTRGEAIVIAPDAPTAMAIVEDEHGLLRYCSAKPVSAGACTQAAA